MKRLALVALALALTIVPARAHETSSRAVYLGNEGVLVVRGDVKVVFDAFYADSYGRYVVPSERTLSELRRGTPPYDGIDAVFVSHVHGDHFSPGPMLAYLRAQSDVRLYAPRQVLDALVEAAGADEPVLGRVTAVDLAPGDPPKRISVAGLDILAAAVPHAGGARMSSVRNVVFRVTLDDATTVIHLGDAAADEAQFEPLHDALAARAIDAAFPPYWFFEGEAGRRILARHVRADRAIGIHVPAAAIGEGDAWRRRLDADVFTDPGESRSLDQP